MKEYFTLNIAIEVAGEWFLPFEQYEIKGFIMMPLVHHRTREGYTLRQKTVEENHFVVKKNEKTIAVPARAGAVVNFEIPEEFVNRHQYLYDLKTDGITDYIKAAAKYLNIQIRFRPESAKWYRDAIKSEKKETGKHTVGENYVQEKKARD